MPQLKINLFQATWHYTPEDSIPDSDLLHEYQISQEIICC